MVRKGAKPPGPWSAIMAGSDRLCFRTTNQPNSRCHFGPNRKEGFPGRRLKVAG